MAITDKRLYFLCLHIFSRPIKSKKKKRTKITFNCNLNQKYIRIGRTYRRAIYVLLFFFLFVASSPGLSLCTRDIHYDLSRVYRRLNVNSWNNFMLIDYLSDRVDEKKTAFSNKFA